jgi:hypothetical protein
MVISRFTTISAGAVAALAATLLASPVRAAADRAECTAEQRDLARRMLRAECPTSVTASATVYCSWYGAVEISNVECGPAGG